MLGDPRRPAPRIGPRGVPTGPPGSGAWRVAGAQARHHGDRSGVSGPGRGAPCPVLAFYRRPPANTTLHRAVRRSCCTCRTRRRQREGLLVHSGQSTSSDAERAAYRWCAAASTLAPHRKTRTARRRTALSGAYLAALARDRNSISIASTMSACVLTGATCTSTSASAAAT